MSTTSALENNEDLENVPLVRMADIQPDRSCEVINSSQIEVDYDIDDEHVINYDEESNIGSMVLINSEEIVSTQDDNSDSSELIVPDVLQTSMIQNDIKLKPKAPESWPTLEILPGGVIKNADKYEDDLLSSCPAVTEKIKTEVGEMMYVCAKCSESFDNLILLVKHVRWHDEELKKQKELDMQKLQTKKVRIQPMRRKLISEMKTKCKMPKKS